MAIGFISAKYPKALTRTTLVMMFEMNESKTNRAYEASRWHTLVPRAAG